MNFELTNRLPSVKTLTRIAGDRARELRIILETESIQHMLDLLAQGKYPNTREWNESVIRSNRSRMVDLKMRIADEILSSQGNVGHHGVEYIPAGHNAHSPAITYSNTGDAYTETLLFLRGSFRVGSWGDIVEQGNYD